MTDILENDGGVLNETYDPWSVPYPGGLTPGLQEYLEKWAKTGDDLDPQNPHMWSWLYHHVLFNAVTIAPTGSKEAVPWVPGHYGNASYLGPNPNVNCELMVIGKLPSFEEVVNSSLMCGDTGSLLKEVLDAHGIDWGTVYFTNICRFPLPDRANSVAAKWLKDCRPFLEKEIELVNPRAILLLGAEPLKALFPGALVKDSRGEIMRWERYPAFVSIHPGQALRDPSYIEDLNCDIDNLKDFLNNGEYTLTSRVDRALEGYTVVRDVESLKRLLCSLTALIPERGELLLGFDGEWGYKSAGSREHPVLRTVQLAWGKTGKEAAIIYLGEVENKSYPYKQEMLKVLEVFLNFPEVRLMGHNLRADFLVFRQEGVDLTRKMQYAEDTILLKHLLRETGDHGLSALALKYTTFGRYDSPLVSWCAQQKKLTKQDPLDYGYAFIPDELLEPYAVLDVLVLQVAYPKLKAELDKDPALSELYRRAVMPAGMAILDMEYNGICVDMERGMQMTDIFVQAKEILTAKLREMINWSDFNPRSSQQAAAVLFSTTPYKDKKEGLVPETARPLSLTPVTSTASPYKRPWAQIAQNKLSSSYTPCTDDETCEILSDEPTGFVKWFRYFKVVDQVLKSQLRPGVEVEGEMEFDKGYLGSVWSDGRIHTTISQLKETGRWSSSKPNLHAIPKAREKIIHESVRAALPGIELPGIRSIFVAPPGSKIIEADFCQAELNVLAWLSGDKNLEGALNTPGRSLHAEMAIKAYSLDTSLTADEVKAKYPDIYTAAKSVNFGIMYDRGAKALSRETGKTVEECEKMILIFSELYPEAWAYLLQQANKVATEGELVNPFGRRRRFFPDPGHAPEDIAKLQREGRNFPYWIGEVKQGEFSESLDKHVFAVTLSQAA